MSGPVAHHDSLKPLVFAFCHADSSPWHARCQQKLFHPNPSKTPGAKSRDRRSYTNTWLPVSVPSPGAGPHARLAEQLHRIDEGLQHPEHERDADKAPGQHELHCCRCIRLICAVHVRFSPYARAPARRPTGSTPRLSLSRMWNRLSTALTKKLQMKPITSNPAMMYMVVL